MVVRRWRQALRSKARLLGQPLGWACATTSPAYTVERQTEWHKAHVSILDATLSGAGCFSGTQVIIIRVFETAALF